MTNINPFQIEIPDQSLEDLGARLALTRLPERETPSDWSQGVPLDYMREVLMHGRGGPAARTIHTAHRQRSR